MRLRAVWSRSTYLPLLSPSGPEDGNPSSGSRVEGSICTASYHLSDLFFIVLIALAGITAVWLRWCNLSSQSFWLDEGYTLWISRFSPRDIWEVLRIDSTSPLYYILTHYWSACFGTSEFWLRSLSALFGTLSVPLFYILARKMLADRLAIVFAMAIYAVSLYQVWYAKEARSYALLVFLSLGTVYCLLLYLEKRDSVRFCGVVLFLAAILYTHNIALFYLPGITVLWLVYPSGRGFFVRVKDGLLISSIVLLLYLPWLTILRAQLQRQRDHGNVWLTAPGIRDFLYSLCVLSGFDPQTLQEIFRGQFHSTRLFGIWTWAPTVLIILVACIIGGLWAARTNDRRKTAALVAYSLSPMFLVFAYSRIANPIYVSRLFVGSCALLPILLCAPIAFQVGRGRKLFQLLGCAVLVGAVVSTVGYLRREQKEDWRGAAEYLMDLPERPRLTVVVPDTGQPLMQYYAARLSKPGPPMEVTGLLTRFDPPDLGLERRTVELGDNQNTDFLGQLSYEMTSGKYREVDVVSQQHVALPLIKPMLEYLTSQCASLEVVEFHWVEVRRCSVRSAIGE